MRLKAILGSLRRRQSNITSRKTQVRHCLYITNALSFSHCVAVRAIKSAAAPFSVEFQPIVDGIKERTSHLKTAVDVAQKEGKFKTGFHFVFISCLKKGAEEKRREILDWISKVHYQDAHINASTKRVRDTCNWLRKKEAYLRWAGSSGSAVLWVHGKGTW